MVSIVQMIAALCVLGGKVVVLCRCGAGGEGGGGFVRMIVEMWGPWRGGWATVKIMFLEV